jgi:hydrogenase-4 component H
MLKMLKLGIFKKGIATKNYPAEPYLPPAGSMGEPSVEMTLCDFCGACAAACPSNAITVAGSVEISLGRCVFCGACCEACPRRAIQMTGEFELSTKSKESLKVTYR